MKVTCIVASAGKGKRLGSAGDKPFIKLGGKPLLSHTIKAFESSAVIDDIIVVVSRDRIRSCERLVRKYGFKKVRAVLRGGKKRFDSVKNGLAAVKDAGYVLIHDGARPFADEGLIKRVLAAVKKYGAALPATPSKQTLKLVNKNLFISGTPKRNLLWEAQTPQGFKKNLIIKAYGSAKDRSATDDSCLAERMGLRVKIVRGSYKNIKITTPEDLKLAKVLVKKSK